MGRGLNTALNILDSATRPSCSYCGNKCKSKYWFMDNYPSKKFCKKTCLNKYEKIQLQMADTGCSLCGKKNNSLKYYQDWNKKYCTKKHYNIGTSDALILKINYL